MVIHLNSIGDGEIGGKVLGNVEDVMKGSRIDDVFITPVSNQFIIPILFGDHETVVAAIWYDDRMLIMYDSCRIVANTLINDDVPRAEDYENRCDD